MSVEPSHSQQLRRSNRYRLLKNTVMLYILQFAIYFLNFLTVPYQTRVMGPDFFGTLGYIASIMLFFQLFVDFGFMLYATSEVSRHREDRTYVSKILTSVVAIKAVLSVISVIAMTVLCFSVPSLRSEFDICLLYLFGTLAASFIPDFIYRGMEDMGAITMRTVLVKTFFTAMVFVLLKEPSDYYVVPLLILCGNLAALLAASWHLHKKFQIRVSKADRRHVLEVFRESSKFFFSRIATTVYGASNTVILGTMGAGASIGHYVSTDRLVEAAKSAVVPISDSLYPYMIKNKDYRLVKKMLMVLLPVVVVACGVVFMFADQICVLLFGGDFAAAGPVLRAFTPVLMVALPSYILGFPLLGAMGLVHHANRSIIFATVSHVACLCALYFAGTLNMVTLALATSLTECLVFAYRAVVIYRHKERLRS